MYTNAQERHLAQSGEQPGLEQLGVAHKAQHAEEVAEGASIRRHLLLSHPFEHILWINIEHIVYNVRYVDYE